MHGIILAELKKYVETKLGADQWPALLDAAGLPGKTYLMSQEYPDAEVVQLVTTASKLTGLPVPAILEDFGEFIVPDLVKTYKAFIDPSWKTLDLIEYTETAIHRAVRIKDRGAHPPELRTDRKDERAVVVTYASPRKMCAIAKGIVKGVAAHYGEQVLVSEKTCMHKGAPACQITVRLARA